jgi:hypothetical protein
LFETFYKHQENPDSAQGLLSSSARRPEEAAKVNGVALVMSHD